MAGRKVIVFHSDEGVRRWIADALHSAHGKFGVVGDTGSMQEALILARFHQPDTLVVGFAESSDMADFVYGLRAAAPTSRLIGYVAEDQEVPSVVPGYDAFVLHKKNSQKLLEAFERASRPR